MINLNDFLTMLGKRSLALFWGEVKLTQIEIERGLSILYESITRLNYYADKILSIPTESEHVISPRFTFTPLKLQALVATSFIYHSLGVNILEIITPLANIDQKIELNNQDAEAVTFFETRRLDEMKIAQKKVNRALNDYYAKAEKHMEKVVEAMKKLETARQNGDLQGIVTALNLLKAQNQLIAKTVDVLDLRKALIAVKDIIDRSNNVIASPELTFLSKKMNKSLKKIRTLYEIRLFSMPILWKRVASKTSGTVEVNERFIARDMFVAQLPKPVEK